MAWLTNISSQLETDIRDADVTADVVAGGPVGETISMRAALARQAGDWRGRVVCLLLNILQPGHCRRVLAGEDAPWWVYVWGVVLVAGAIAGARALF
jgi:hypothetical protein